MGKMFYNTQRENKDLTCFNQYITSALAETSAISNKVVCPTSSCPVCLDYPNAPQLCSPSPLPESNQSDWRQVRL